MTVIVNEVNILWFSWPQRCGQGTNAYCCHDLCIKPFQWETAIPAATDCADNWKGDVSDVVNQYLGICEFGHCQGGGEDLGASRHVGCVINVSVKGSSNKWYEELFSDGRIGIKWLMCDRLILSSTTLSTKCCHSYVQLFYVSRFLR